MLSKNCSRSEDLDEGSEHYSPSISSDNFNRLVEYYKTNCEKPWHEWLKVKAIFPKQGKQGLVGLMVAKDDPQLVFIFKISQHINYLVQHELIVMKALNPIADFCPHFSHSIGGILCEVDPTKKKGGNPFQRDSQFVIEKEVLLTQYIDRSCKFNKYIHSHHIPDSVLYSVIKQTLLGIAIAQRIAQFTHYDLHSNNIMVKQCDPDLVFLYILDNDNQFCVPSHGYYPIIIDFGFSYAGQMDGGPLWPTLGHTDVGFMSSEFDPLADPKLFLVTVASEIRERRRNKKSKILQNIVRNIFHPLDICWDSGWDTDEDKSVAEQVTDVLRKYNDESNLFEDFDHYCIDILQSLVILPLEEQPVKNLQTAFITFIHEFAKIEREISSPFYCMYILKGIVDDARVIRADYSRKKKRKKAVNFFRLSLHERIKQVASFCQLKNLNYERLLCSLLCLARCLEGMMYKGMKERRKKKSRMYRKMPLQTIEEMLSVIDINIPSKYHFNDNTVVMVIDSRRQEKYTLTLSEEERELINHTASISRGPELYHMLKREVKNNSPNKHVI